MIEISDPHYNALEEIYRAFEESNEEYEWVLSGHLGRGLQGSDEEDEEDIDIFTTEDAVDYLEDSLAGYVQTSARKVDVEFKEKGSIYMLNLEIEGVPVEVMSNFEHGGQTLYDFNDSRLETETVPVGDLEIPVASQEYEKWANNQTRPEKDVF